ncbi:MAG: tRNA (adenosine(37)-N6)-threonylcarbamoyltransferase complex transferase subunit TsaD [Planctomycetota bacterium]|nr:tRNA (adenosine(37)-N6)-threonylcarbamoyltransferase complex transferase subunit TsaD [Planctomycetota bacterium]
MPLILGIESTCDETAAAVVVDGYRVLSNVIASQIDLHAKYQGVVPEIASRAHIENILPVIREAIHNANTSLDQLDAIAVAHRPGLIGSLLIGVTAAKTLAFALNKPLIAVDHVHAHLYSVVLETNIVPPMPAVGLVVSGGHTALYHLQDLTTVRLVGSTLDDAVGEAYDKVASILGLGYPGGPVIDRLAATGDPKAVPFPRSMLGRQSLDFSFSGLKTAVLYHVRGYQGRQRPVTSLSPQKIADVAASFQAASIDVLSRKLHRALSQTNAKSVIIGGGVSANRGLRLATAQFPVPVFFPLPAYCTDNAAMSAGLAHLAFLRRDFASLDLDAITYSRFRLT